MGLEHGGHTMREIIENSQNIWGKMPEHFSHLSIRLSNIKEMLNICQAGTPMGATQSLWQSFISGRVRVLRVTLGHEDGVVGKTSPPLDLTWTILSGSSTGPWVVPCEHEPPLPKGVTFPQELPVTSGSAFGGN